jgi:hypothetical protein
MAKTSLSPNSSCVKPEPNEDFERREILHKNYYFDNEKVERLLHEYLEGACTNVRLRDEIMIHASELIHQIIKAHNLSQICPGKDDSSINDLFQTAWIQIESALYKYEAKAHCAKCYNAMRPNDSVLIESYAFTGDVVKRIGRCPYCKVKLEPGAIYYRGKSKVFNMYSQIARTVILAYIKKENRDRKNSPVFQTHLENKTVPKSHALDRFLHEAAELCQHSEDNVKILDAIKQLYIDDDKPHEGLISKLVSKSGLPRSTVTSFLKIVRLRSFEFTDSPVNEEIDTVKRKQYDGNDPSTKEPE